MDLNNRVALITKPESPQQLLDFTLDYFGQFIETIAIICSIPHHIAIALLDLIRTEYLAGWL